MNLSEINKVYNRKNEIIENATLEKEIETPLSISSKVFLKSKNVTPSSRQPLSYIFYFGLKFKCFCKSSSISHIGLLRHHSHN